MLFYFKLVEIQLNVSGYSTHVGCAAASRRINFFVSSCSIPSNPPKRFPKKRKLQEMTGRLRQIGVIPEQDENEYRIIISGMRTV